MPSEIFRRIGRAERARVLGRLEWFLGAIVKRAVEAYGGAYIGEVFDAIDDLAREWTRCCADRGAFLAFGVRDRGDLVSLPTMIYPGYPPGVIAADVAHAARVIAAGGSRDFWVAPADLEITVAAR